MIRVRVRAGEETVLREFAKDIIIIGRPNPYLVPDLDLAGDITVSRSHARLWVQDGACWVEDLSSKHGTLVNGVLIDYQRQISDRDVVRVGETEFTVEAPQSAPGTPAPLQPQADPAVRVDTALNPEDTSLQEAADAVGPDRARLALLLETPIVFVRVSDQQKLMQLVVERVLKIIPGADRSAILLRNEETDELEVKAWVSKSEPPVSDTLARRALTEGRALIWRRIIDGVISDSLRRLEMKTGMYAPLIWEHRTIGVLCVDNPRRDTRFTEGDLKLLLAVAQYAAMAVAVQRRVALV